MLSTRGHEVMIRWIHVTRNDAVINARLCLSNASRLSSRRVLKGCMQVEWFSEPKRQTFCRVSLNWSRAHQEEGGCGWPLPKPHSPWH